MLHFSSLVRTPHKLPTPRAPPPRPSIDLFLSVGGVHIHRSRHPQPALSPPHADARPGAHACALVLPPAAALARLPSAAPLAASDPGAEPVGAHVAVATAPGALAGASDVADLALAGASLADVVGRGGALAEGGGRGREAGGAEGSEAGAQGCPGRRLGGTVLSIIESVLMSGGMGKGSRTRQTTVPHPEQGATRSRAQRYSFLPLAEVVVDEEGKGEVSS